jgi:hypothetical protein
MILRKVSEVIEYHWNFGRRFAEHDCLNVFGKVMKDLNSFRSRALHGKRILVATRNFLLRFNVRLRGPR